MLHFFHVAIYRYLQGVAPHRFCAGVDFCLKIIQNIIKCISSDFLLPTVYRLELRFVDTHILPGRESLFEDTQYCLYHRVIKYCLMIQEFDFLSFRIGLH